MKGLRREALRVVAEQFKALSSPARLEILQHICTEERTVGELVELTGHRQSNVSKQLGLLDRAGLVRRRQEGSRVYYVVADRTLPQLCDIICDSLRARQVELREVLDG